MLTSETIPDEPKSARLELRTQPQIKETIKRAAMLAGVDISTFIIRTVYEEAKATISSHELTFLETNRDREIFFNALDKPSKPTKHLKDAFALHAELIKNAD